MPSPTAAAGAAASEAPMPNDARTIEAILHTMGVDDYDPRVTHQLLELLYRYTSSVLIEARTFSEHADKPAIDPDDIKLAVRARSTFTFTQPPPRDVAMRLAAERNAIPLPPVDQHAGLALPHDVLQLTRHNFRVVRAAPRPTESSPRTPKRPRVSGARTSPAALRRAQQRVDPNVVIDVDNPNAPCTSASAAQTTTPATTSGAAPPQSSSPPSATPANASGNTSQAMDVVDLDAPPVPPQ